MKPKDIKELLLSSVEDNDYGAETVVELLLSQAKQLLLKEGGEFHENMIRSLILNRQLRGELDAYGFVDDYDRKELNSILSHVLDFLIDSDHTTLELPPEPKEYAVINLSFVSGTNQGKVVGYVRDLMTKEEAENWLETNPPLTSDYTTVVAKVK